VSATAQVRAGTAFGPYELVRQIAVGGMAEIYLAKATGISGFEKHVALKMIHPNYAEDAHFIEMLVEEAKIAVLLNQKNIVQVFDLGRIGETYYIAMEFVDGPDLYHIMRSLTDLGVEVPFEVAAFLAAETCAALDYAHRCVDPAGEPLNLIHRDISPQNILVSRAGEVKLADFGIAKVAGRARQTAVGVIKGKYYYMSPEQAWGDPIDLRTDIFSTGVVLYEVIVGRMLYLEEDIGRLLDLVRKADIDPPSVHRPDVPAELERIVMKAVSRRPEDRYQSAHDLQVALMQFLFRRASGWSIQRLQQLVDRAIRALEDERRRTAEAQARAQQEAVLTLSFDDLEIDLMDAQEFRPLTTHSVISLPGVSTLEGAAVPALPSSLDLFSEDHTVVSEAPQMAELLGEIAPRRAGPSRSPLAKRPPAPPPPPPPPPVPPGRLRRALPADVLEPTLPPELPALPPGPRRPMPSESGIAPAFPPPLPGDLDLEGWDDAEEPTTVLDRSRDGAAPGNGPILDPQERVAQDDMTLPLGPRALASAGRPVTPARPASGSPPASAPRPAPARTPAPSPARVLPAAPRASAAFPGVELDDDLDEEASLALRRRQAQRNWVLIGLLLCGVLIGAAVFIIVTRQAATRPGSVTVETIPSGARLYYRDRATPVGSTPQRLEGLDPDELHEIRLVHPRCAVKSTAVRVTAGGHRTVVVSLEQCDPSERSSPQGTPIQGR
jgi:serine/threonine-protein kinase